jgi:hypothetical protein
MVVYISLTKQTPVIRIRVQYVIVSSATVSILACTIYNRGSACWIDAMHVHQIANDAVSDVLWLF